MIQPSDGMRARLRARLPARLPVRLPVRLPALLLAGTAVLLSGCDDDPVAPSPAEPVEQSFTFSQDMDGWQAAATDTLNPPIEWHVRHSTEESVVGDGAVELFLENLNDQGKIWMERSFELEPGVFYDVDIEFAFGTSDWGQVNLFTVIAGVHAEPPRDAEDLTFQDDTGHGGDEDVGLVWEDRTYRLSTQAPADGSVYVTIGVWGTWETARTYFVDDVTVRFTPMG